LREVVRSLNKFINNHHLKSISQKRETPNQDMTLYSRENEREENGKQQQTNKINHQKRRIEYIFSCFFFSSFTLILDLFFLFLVHFIY